MYSSHSITEPISAWNEHSKSVTYTWVCYGPNQHLQHTVASP